MREYKRFEDIEKVYREIESDDKKLCEDFMTLSLETIGSEKDSMER